MQLAFISDCIRPELRRNTFAIHATTIWLVTQLLIKDQLVMSQRRAMQSTRALLQDRRLQMGLGQLVLF